MYVLLKSYFEYAVNEHARLDNQCDTIACLRLQSGKFNKWGDKCTVYLVLYITPVGSELELPDEEKKFAPALAHKKFHLAGTCTVRKPDCKHLAAAGAKGPPF